MYGPEKYPQSLLDTRLEKLRIRFERTNRMSVGHSLAGVTALMDGMRGEVPFRVRFALEHERARVMV